MERPKKNKVVKTSAKELRKNAEYTIRNHQSRVDYWRSYNATKRVHKKNPRISELSPEEREWVRYRRAAYAKKNAVKLSAYWKKYRADHPEKTKAHNKANWHRRRALILKSTVNMDGIKAWMREILSKRSSVCYYCRTRIPKKKIHFDHILPLAAGGPHSLGNLCVSCSECNLSKGGKLITDWIRPGEQGLLL